MQKYIGKSKETQKWVKANNMLVDPKNGDTYLVPDLFSMDELKLDSKSLAKYKIEKSSLGIAVAKDINKEIIYSGDLVEVHYYNQISNATKKYMSIAIVCYDSEAKLYYMKGTDEKRVFLFSGDSHHFISSITRIDERPETALQTNTL